MTKKQKEDVVDPDDFADSSPNPSTDIELAVLGDALQERCVTRALARYAGSGDSGSVEEVEYTPVDVCLPEWIQIMLIDLAEHYCPDGYENNEGGYGTLTIYPFQGLAELKHYECYEDAEAMDASATALPEALQQQLAQRGVKSVTVTFDGCGDSGQVDLFTYDPEGTEVDLELQDALEDFLLDQLPGGWENNAGSFGTFEVSVESGEVELDAYDRIEANSDAQVTRWQWRQ